MWEDAECSEAAYGLYARSEADGERVPAPDGPITGVTIADEEVELISFTRLCPCDSEQHVLFDCREEEETPVQGEGVEITHVRLIVVSFSQVFTRLRLLT